MEAYEETFGIDKNASDERRLFVDIRSPIGNLATVAIGFDEDGIIEIDLFPIHVVDKPKASIKMALREVMREDN